MNIHLKNIGIVEDSNIQLNGLTVITGKNNSGKTTVSKVLYSLIEATTDIEHRALIDRQNYITKMIFEVRNTLDVFRFTHKKILNSEEPMISEKTALGRLIYGDYPFNVIEESSSEEYARSLLVELEKFDVNELVKSGKLNEHYAQLISRTGSISEVANSFTVRIQKAYEILVKLFEVLDRDKELVNYSRERINQTLKKEFSGQIQPINNTNVKSFVELYDEDTLFFKLEICNDNVVNAEKPVFISSPFNKAIFLDDPFVLDRSKRIFMHSRYSEMDDTILNARRIVTHDLILSDMLREPKKTSVFEDTVLQKELLEIKTQINKTIPGTFEFSDEGEFYVQNNKKLQFSNLATGSKMFSFVKILLEKGMIDKNTLLIFDEPEAHLHPDWQNTFAEVITMLVDKLGVNVLLTTHSSNFMLAIDAYMRKYKINSKSNFYQTEYLENGAVNYRNVNENMGEIYEDFMESFAYAKMLRNEYIVE